MHLDGLWGDHMVIQRNKQVIIQGTSCSPVFMEYDQKVYTSFWHDDCHFSIRVIFTKPVISKEMIIYNATERLILHDVCIGDVFLCAGQSNMALKRKELKPCPYEPVQNVRYLNVSDQKETWCIMDEESSHNVSALAYYFSLHISGDVPIGLISCNQGGTSASCWVSKETLEKDQDLFQSYYLDYYKDLSSIEEQKRLHDEYWKLFDTYQKKYHRYMSEHPEMSVPEVKRHIGHTPWPPPKGIFDSRKPCNYYNTYFLQIIHMPIAAVIFYQGEEDRYNPKGYLTLLQLLIENWRHDYDDEIPFFIVQLPEYKDHFSAIREVQREISLLLPSVYLVVSLGLGEADNIHPQDKRELGLRIAYSVNHYYYHKSDPVSPQLLRIKRNKDSYILIYDQPLVEGNVSIVVDDEKVTSTIKGDQIKIPVKGDIHTLSYAMEDVPQIEIENRQMLPASPFLLKLKNG